MIIRRFDLSGIAVVCIALAAVVPALAQTAPNGKEIFEKTCAACHATGAAGAPKLGDAQEWKTRSGRGAGALFLSAFQGKNAMPPRGGNSALSNLEVEAAVVYLVSQSLGLPPERVAKLPAQSAAPSVSQSGSKPAQTPESPKPDAPKGAATDAKTAATATEPATGKSIYQSTCAACHASGLAGAPKIGEAGAWEPRLVAGKTALYASALKGKNAMPAKGGNAALGDAEIKAAVDFMIAQLKTGIAQKPANAGTQTATPPQSPPPTSAAVSDAALAEGGAGKATYEAICAACHSSGLAGAPKFGDKAAWGPRIAVGTARLHESALKGRNAMPAKGGNAALSDNDVKAAVDFMIAKVGKVEKDKTDKPDRSGDESGKPTAVVAAVTTRGDVSDPAKSGSANTKEPGRGPGPNDGTAATPAGLADTSAKTAADATSTQSSAKAAQPGNVSTPPGAATATADPNAFNRLLKPAGKRNLPAPESGIHDPTNDGTHMLQPPLQAFGALPRSSSGNQVDWVKALNEAKINPRMDKTDASVDPLVLDMNIVREVKGSMPDVVYPHKQHTQWLDCSNCHPAIFVPQKGANQISMAAILLGQKCGVCHGKVAFPVSECRLCHSKNKEAKTAEKNP